MDWSREWILLHGFILSSSILLEDDSSRWLENIYIYIYTEKYSRNIEFNVELFNEFIDICIKFYEHIWFALLYLFPISLKTLMSSL